MSWNADVWKQTRLQAQKQGQVRWCSMPFYDTMAGAQLPLIQKQKNSYSPLYREILQDVWRFSSCDLDIDAQLQLRPYNGQTTIRRISWPKSLPVSPTVSCVFVFELFLFRWFFEVCTRRHDTSLALAHIAGLQSRAAQSVALPEKYHFCWLNLPVFF